MEKVILKAEIREEVGKSKVRGLRKKDLIPGVVYKGGKEALNIKVDQRTLFDILHTSAGENVLITLKIGEDKKSKEKTCIIKELQRDPVKEDILHVDLNEISLTEKIKVKVGIHSRGTPEGVTKDGGVLDRPIWEVDVECLPMDIPERIDVEVGKMKIGDAIYIKDLQAPPGVKILNDPELTVLSVVPPAKEEVAEEVPAEGGLEEPEVIKKGKKEEEEIPEEGAAEKPKKEEKAVPGKEDKKKE